MCKQTRTYPCNKEPSLIQSQVAKFSNHIQMNQEWIVAKCTVSPSLAFSIWKFLLSEFIYKFYINCVSIQFYPGLLPDFRVANQNN